MDFAYKFPVVKGKQAGREYFIAMVPLKMLSRLFPNEEEYVLPEYRAQRKLNESRIPVISKYITDNRESYVFSALAACLPVLLFSALAVFLQVSLLPGSGPDVSFPVQIEQGVWFPAHSVYAGAVTEPAFSPPASSPQKSP